MAGLAYRLGVTSRIACLAALALFILGCADHRGVIRLESPGNRTPVLVTTVQFDAEMMRLTRDLQAASAAPRPTRLTPVAWWSEAAQTVPDRVILSSYDAWCQHTRRISGDCLTVLRSGFGPDERRALALGIALETGAVWAGAVETWRRMADPVGVQGMLTVALAGYLVLLLAPEPITKPFVIALTGFLVAYLGWDTLWGLLEGWSRLTAKAESALLFEDIHEEGRRFGTLLGTKAGQLFVLLLTAAIGQTAGLVVNGPLLPGYAEAAMLAEQQGFRLSAVGEVDAITIAEGHLTLNLAAGAIALPHSGFGGERALAPTESWGNANTLERHFRDHGADFGAKTADEYARMASEFFQRGQRERLSTKIDADGIIRVFDPKTNTFGSFNPDGTTRTFFKPSSPTYWDRQPGVAPRAPGGK